MTNDEENGLKEHTDKEVKEVNDTNEGKTEDYLDESKIEKQDVKIKKSINKKLIIAASSIASILLLITMILGVSSFKRNQTLKQAESLISMGKFEEAIAIYDNLLMKKYIPELIVKKDAVIELMESEENLQKGLEAFDDDNTSKSVKYLSKVPKTDKARYKKALEKLEELEESTAIRVEDLIGSGNIDEATKIVNEYLKLSPDSVDMQNAREDIEAKRVEIENQAKADEQAKKDQEAAAVEATAKAEQAAAAAVAQAAKAEQAAAASYRTNEEARRIASNLKGTYQTIISGEANVRSAPTKKASVIGTLSRGSRVYIYDTSVESSERIWCQVRSDYYSSAWISYNTMNYKIQ